MTSLDSYEDDESRYDDIVPEEELEKVRLLLKGREEILLDIPVDKPKRKFCKSHKKFHKQAVEEQKQQRQKELEDVDKEHFEPPNPFKKNEYLYYVGARGLH